MMKQLIDISNRLINEWSYLLIQEIDYDNE